MWCRRRACARIGVTETCWATAISSWGTVWQLLRPHCLLRPTSHCGRDCRLLPPMVCVCVCVRVQVFVYIRVGV